MDLSAFVGKLREVRMVMSSEKGVRVLAQALMEREVTALVGADRHERTADRTGYRNGTRTRTWDTPVRIRRVGAVLLEQDDEWRPCGRRYFSVESMARLRSLTVRANFHHLTGHYPSLSK